MLSALYAAVARRRRERYAAHPQMRARLGRPVVSVGNLAVGGRGKTPVVASLARLLRDAGERPAVLSRGYRRTRPERGVVVVRDAEGMRADLARSGDEPLMLARQLDGVSVLVCADRYAAGRVAEQELGATVHLLDDGFQHLQLDRDLDLVIVGSDDVRDPRTLPGGRLREPLDTLIAADAVLTADDDVEVHAGGMDLPVFRLQRSGHRPPPAELAGSPVVAVAGIAGPQRFFDDLRAHGWQVAQAVAFRDHHSFTARDLRRLADAARSAGAAAIVTTEKDYVRLLPLRPFPLRIEHVPIALDPEPRVQFRDWILREIATVRGGVRG